jgi:hypothetical protein
MITNGFMHGYLIGYLRKQAQEPESIEPNPWSTTFSVQAPPPGVPRAPNKLPTTPVPDLKSAANIKSTPNGAKVGTKPA